MAHNAQARYVYATHGFAEEGVMRRAHKGLGDARIDLVLMSQLRPEWQAQAGSG